MSVLPPAVAAALDPEASPVTRSVLRAVGSTCGHSLGQDIVRALHRLSARVAEPQVSVVFAGRFSSGKSTLLNALLGCDLLPTGDYPETGVPFRIVTWAAERAALRRTDGSIATVSCTPSDIAEVVRRIGDDGAPRPQLRTAAELTITLSSPVIPTGTCWVDTPGVDDGTGLPERWDQVTGGADLLVWVTRSDAALGLGEMRLLDRHLAQHGPEGCLLVINVVLRADDDEQFTKIMAGPVGAGLRRRVQDATDNGGPELGEPVLLAARAMGRAGSGFGGDPLRRLLADPDLLRRRAATSRLHQARWELGQMIEWVQGQLAAARSQQHAQHADARTRTEHQQAQDAQFAGDLAAAVATQVRQCGTRLLSLAAQLADGIADTGPVAAADLGRSLQQGVEAELTAMRTDVERVLAELCSRYRRPAPHDEATRWLAEHLIPTDPGPSLARIDQPHRLTETKTNVAAATGSVVGAVVGTVLFMPFIGAAVGGAVGGAIGGQMGRVTYDQSALRQAVRAIGAAEADRVAQGEPDLIAALLAGCSQEPQAPPESGRARGDALQELLELVLQPAWQAIVTQPAIREGQPASELAATG